jgi:hypothetical protein
MVVLFFLVHDIVGALCPYNKLVQLRALRRMINGIGPGRPKLFGQVAEQRLRPARSSISWFLASGNRGAARDLRVRRREFIPLLGGSHPPLLLQQIPDLEHDFHTPPLGKS